eukprot:2145475-Alexandrium_andersonii.AAC.1
MYGKRCVLDARFMSMQDGSCQPWQAGTNEQCEWTRRPLGSVSLAGCEAATGTNTSWRSSVCAAAQADSMRPERGHRGH